MGVLAYLDHFRHKDVIPLPEHQRYVFVAQSLGAHHHRKVNRLLHEAEVRRIDRLDSEVLEHLIAAGLKRVDRAVEGGDGQPQLLRNFVRLSSEVGAVGEHQHALQGLRNNFV